MAKLTHLDEDGRARMVDVGGKDVTSRSATARAEVILRPQTLAVVISGDVPKGDVLAVARIAGITGGKRTPDLIPLTHPIGLDSLKVEVTPDGGDPVRFGEGDLVTFPGGMSCRWKISKAVKKHYKFGD